MGILDSLFGGGSSTPQPVVQTNKSKLSKQANQIVNPAVNTLQSIAKNPTQLNLPAPVPLNAQQQQAQQTALGATPAISGIASGAAGATNLLTNPDILDASSNPYLSSYIDAAVRPLTQAYEQTTLPNIRSGAIANAGLGGSRQGISEGIAAQNLYRQVGDTSADIASKGYGQGLSALQQGIQLAPGTANLQLGPANVQAAVGQQNYDLANQAQQRQISNQYLPFLTSADLLGLAGAIPGASTGISSVTPAATTKQPGLVQSGLGGAATGAALGSVIPGVGTGIGAGLGALYGILGR